MIAAAILIKPFAILAALHLAIRKHFATLGWAIVAGIALLVVPVVVFGPHGLIDQTGAYVTAIASMTNRYRTMLTNQSAVSAVARLMSLRIGADAETSPTATIVGMGLEIILIAAVSLWDWKSGDHRSFTNRLALCGLFCLMPSFAPISWKSYYAAILVPYMALTAALWTDRNAGRSAPILVWSLFALSVRTQSRDGKLSEPHRPLLLGAFRFVAARTGRRIRVVARNRGGPGMRAPAKMNWRSNPNFLTFEIGRRRLVIHRQAAPQAAQILHKLSELAATSEAGAGNRESAFRLDLGDGLELFARRGRRGGMIASILSDVYLGMSPRPLTELTVTIEARRRGIPVAEPMGAMVEWIGPALYRGFFLTRAVRGMTLWEFVKTDDDPTVREHVLEQARAAIDTMHTNGLFHADLNLHNLLVTQVRERFTVIIHRPGQGAARRRAVVACDAPGERGASATLSAQARSVGKISRRGRAFDSESGVTREFSRASARWRRSRLARRAGAPRPAPSSARDTAARSAHHTRGSRFQTRRGRS